MHRPCDAFRVLDMARLPRIAFVEFARRPATRCPARQRPSALLPDHQRLSALFAWPARSDARMRLSYPCFRADDNHIHLLVTSSESRKAPTKRRFTNYEEAYGALLYGSAYFKTMRGNPDRSGFTALRANGCLRQFASLLRHGIRETERGDRAPQQPHRPAAHVKKMDSPLPLCCLRAHPAHPNSPRST